MAVYWNPGVGPERECDFCAFYIDGRPYKIGGREVCRECHDDENQARAEEREAEERRSA